jgi:uncharacterized protein YcbX
MKLEQVVRYPVKGLGPEYLSSAIVDAGGPIPFDREYAIAHGVTEFDPKKPKYLEKHHFLMLMRNPPLASLKTAYQEEDRRITVTFPDGSKVSACLADEQDRKRLDKALNEFIGDKSRGGPARIVSASDHRFFDVPDNYLSLINLASVEDLGRTLSTNLDPIRFRANLYVSQLPPWREVNLVGREFLCGKVRLRAAAAIERCAATSVNPKTAEVDINVPYSLRKHYDTLNMGLYLTVIDGGRIDSGSDLGVI